MHHKNLQNLIPQKFHLGKLRYDSGQSVAVVHATPDIVSSSSEPSPACTLATASHCQRRTSRLQSVWVDILVEPPLLQVVESSGQISVVEDVVQ